jgi:uncharacterized damage-inducible protein DinB
MESDHDRAVRADERTTLSRFLDEQRWAVLRKVEGLTQEQAGATHPPSSLTVGGLVKHLALCEYGWFHECFGGQPMPSPFDDVDWDADPDWEFRTGASDPFHETLELYRTACDRSRAVVAAAASLEELSAEPSKRGEGRFTLRWIVLHMIEETARHVGHADLVRESIDGTTGD